MLIVILKVILRLKLLFGKLLGNDFDIYDYEEEVVVFLSFRREIGDLNRIILYLIWGEFFEC